MKKSLLHVLLVITCSCANLYKERAYVTDVSSQKLMKGDCAPKGPQSRLTLETRKGEVKVSTPIHYDYWWTGPIVLPLFPVGKERPDPSSIKISLIAKEGVLDRDQLMKSQILIHNVTDPILPLTVVYTTEKEQDHFVIQFDHPRLVDLPEFRLKLDESIFKETVPFRLAYDVHYVPLLPVIVGNCVTN